MAISTELEGLVKEFEKEYASAKGATLKRYGEAKGIYDQVIGLFEPGGAFDIGIEQNLGRSRTKAVAQGSQALVDTGLYSTTQTAGLAKRFEEEVGMPARERQTQYRVGQQAEAMRGKAGVIERREDPYPDTNMIAQLMQQASSGPTSVSRGGPGYYVGNTGYASRPSKPTYTNPSKGAWASMGITPVNAFG